ncbi:group II intron-encoded LtrA domain protein, partial [Bacteroides fragilis str. 3998T(B)3]
AHIMPSYHGTESTSLMARLKAREGEYCGEEDNLRMVHVRKLRDLKGKQEWERFMIARQRKTVAVCENCYRKIHGRK